MTNQIVDKKTVSVAIPGDRGPAGEIIEVTAETLPTGAEATVTLGGTPDQRTMHLGLPRGGKGDPGNGSVNSVNGDLGPDIFITKESIGAADADDFSKINGLSAETVEIWVAINGNDATGTGEQAKPFKTIQRAFDAIPKIIDKDHTVMLGNGTYNEDAALVGVTGAGIFVKRAAGEVSAAASTDVTVRSLAFYDCTGYIFLQNLTFTTVPTSATASVLFSRCVYATVNASRFSAAMKAGGKPAIRWDGSGGGSSSNYFSNQAVCLHSLNGSRIRVDSTNAVFGTASDVHISAQAAQAFLNGPNAWSTKRKTSQGGQIFESGEPYRQRGFAFVRGDGTDMLTLPIVFPVPLSEASSFQVTFVGARPYASGAPSKMADCTTNWGSFKSVYGTDVNGIDATVRLRADAVHSANFYFGVSWVLEGTL